MRSASAAEPRWLAVADASAARERGLLAKGDDRIRERRALSELQHEVAPRRAQRLVDPGEHAPQPVRAIGREEPQPLLVATRAELLERALERLSAQDRGARILELPEPWVEADREWMRLQEPVAEAVNGGDPRAVERSREVGPVALDERRSNARAQLPGRLARVRDDEYRVHVQAAFADRSDVALDEHRRLAGACSRRHEHRARVPRQRRAARR